MGGLQYLSLSSPTLTSNNMIYKNVVGIEMCERFTTMGIATNLVTYLDHTMNQPSATSSTIVSNFSGVAFLTCLLGGVIADSFLGRYWTIAIFAVVEALVINFYILQFITLPTLFR